MEPLTQQEIHQFISHGYVKIDNAFSSEIAADCRAILWKATGCHPDDPSTWTQPVIRISDLRDEPFRQSANTPVLHSAFDQLVGPGNWIPRQSLGSFPIRFPGRGPANDTGWHVDASFPGEDANDYFKWRINVHSKGRALLMLFLFSDVSEQDAPTLLKPGSHLDVARMLEPEGEQGLSFMDLACRLDTISTPARATTTGKAGTVYLCHPFIVHAAQDHHGTVPKFMAQPSLALRQGVDLAQVDRQSPPVKEAILMALGG